MRAVPIRVRVAGAFAVAMAIVLVGGSWFVYASLSSHLSTALDHDLRLRAEDLRALVREGNASLATTSEPRFIESGEAYAQLVDTQGRVVDATKPLGAVSLLTAAQLRQARQEPTFADRPSVPGLDEPSRFLASPVARAGKPYVLVVGATLGDRSDALSSLRDGLVLAVPLALLLATLAGYLLAGVALRPVEAMRSRAASITADAPGERLPVPATGDELERLGKTLNSLLARLEAAVERERGFVADAAHELRTPLALLRTELELALRHGETAEELRESIRASSEEAERLSQLAEDLLLFARADRGELALRREPIDVDSLLASVATRFEWRAAEAGREIQTGAPTGASVEADRLRLEQALGNLVDNALRHGAGEVQLEASSEPGGGIALHVRDEGGGFPDDFLPHAFERFSRANPSRGDTGAGLGLAIVQTIAQAHGGVAVVANRGEGGADVSIALPAPAVRGQESVEPTATAQS
jgi:heavy metal sensor kinase